MKGTKIYLGNAPWRVGNRIGVRAGCRWPFTVDVGPEQKIPDYVPFPFFLAYSVSVLKMQVLMLR